MHETRNQERHNVILKKTVDEILGSVDQSEKKSVYNKICETLVLSQGKPLILTQNSLTRPREAPPPRPPEELVKLLQYRW